MVNLISFFKKFKKFVGNKIYYLLALMWVAGIVEGIGITLFLPILQNGFGGDKLSKVFKATFGFFGIGFSFSLLLILIFVFFVLRAVFLISYTKYFGKLVANLTITLRERVLNRIFTADYLYLLKKETGFINNAIIREVACVVQAFSTFSNLVCYAVYTVIYIVLALVLNFRVTFIILLCSSLLFVFVKRLNMAINQASLDSSLSYGRFHSVLIQALSKLKYLKSTLSYKNISKVINREGEKVSYLDYELSFLQSLTRNAYEPLIVLVIVSLLFYHVVILKKNASEAIFLIFLFLQIARQVLDAQSSYRKFLAARGGIETFNNLEKELEENREDLNLNGISPDFNKTIAFRNVTVVFPNSKMALDNVNITIEPKSIVAFVGPSGSGKSTIANMLTGLIKPQEGEILFGGVSYNRLNLKTLRENIGYVTQEDIIFNASIKDNISLWEENVDENRLAKIVEMAHITSFVNELPEKEDSMLGDNGLDISGGQRQRITIARELYKDMKLLIMDEATSSLDSKAENQIYENLREFKGNKTMIVIAHRLSTIKNVDYIYVLDNGRVIEKGPYEELQRERGEFTRMIEAQKLV